MLITPQPPLSSAILYQRHVNNTESVNHNAVIICIVIVSRLKVGQ